MADFDDFTQEVVRGDTVIMGVTITRPPGGAAVNLTGTLVVCTGRRDPAEPATTAPVFRVDSTSGIWVNAPTAGQCIVYIQGSDTAHLPDWPNLYVDLQMTESDGRISTPLRGRLVLQPDVSRS